MENDWEAIRKSKDAMRRKLAALPIGEKLRILDALAERRKFLLSMKPRTPSGESNPSK